VCKLITEACQRLLNWEETVRSAWIPDEYKELHALLLVVAGRNLKKILELPAWLVATFLADAPEGRYIKIISFDLPPNWIEEYRQAFERVGARLSP
jgi:hypothetical protein